MHKLSPTPVFRRGVVDHFFILAGSLWSKISNAFTSHRLGSPGASSQFVAQCPSVPNNRNSRLSACLLRLIPTLSTEALLPLSYAGGKGATSLSEHRVALLTQGRLPPSSNSHFQKSGQLEDTPGRAKRACRRSPRPRHPDAPSPSVDKENNHKVFHLGVPPSIMEARLSPPVNAQCSQRFYKGVIKAIAISFVGMFSEKYFPLLFHKRFQPHNRRFVSPPIVYGSVCSAICSLSEVTLFPSGHIY